MLRAALNRLFPPPPPPRAVATRHYEGATGGRRLTGAGAMASAAPAMVAARGRLASRARYLVANNGLAAAGATAWVSGLVGSGIKAQSAHPVRAVREDINFRAEGWVDRADADGLRDLYGLQAAIAHSLVVAGEAFGVMLADPDTGELRLRLLDPEQIGWAGDRELADGARILGGIEFDASGRRRAYHVTAGWDGYRDGYPVGYAGRSIRLEAADVLHVFRAEVPGAVRGVSWFAPVLLRLIDHDASVDAQLVRQKIGALLTGFVTTPIGDQVPGPFADGLADGLGGLVGGLEPGTMKVLQPGEDVRFSSPPELGGEAIAFLKVTATEIASGLGIPYESLSGDLSQVNYSSIRAGLVEWRRRCEALQHGTLAFQALRPLWRRWITLEILAGRIDAHDFATNPEAWLSAKFMPPRTDYVNPQQDVRAEAEAIAAGLMSRRQAVAARGYDLENLDAEIAADGARAASLGLGFAITPPAPQEAAP